MLHESWSEVLLPNEGRTSSYVGKPVRLICVKSFLNMLTYGQACLNTFSFSLGLEQKITGKWIFFSQCRIIEASMPDVSYIT